MVCSQLQGWMGNKNWRDCEFETWRSGVLENKRNQQFSKSTNH